MLAYSSTPEPDDREFLERVKESGLLSAFFRAQQDSCAKQNDQHSARYDSDVLNDRAGGTDRWHQMDNELVHVAPVFQMQVIWVQPTSNPMQKMLFLRTKKEIISFHRVTTEDNTAPHAIHRENIFESMEGLFPLDSTKNLSEGLSLGPRQIGPNEYVYTPDQLVKLVEDEGLSYWQYTYERTMNRYPRWAKLGKPIKGERKLFFVLDVMRTLKYIHPDDTIIDLNPGPDTPPPPRFGIPDREKPEGE